MESGNWVKACSEEEIDDGDIIEARLDGLDLVVMRDDEKFFAAQAICPHMDEKLCNGLLRKKKLICTKHLWQWDLETGNPLGVAEERITVYPTCLKDGFVYVRVDA